MSWKNWYLEFYLLQNLNGENYTHEHAGYEIFIE